VTEAGAPARPHVGTAVHGWQRRRQAALVGLLLPYVAGAIALVAIPGLLALGLSFTYFDGLSLPSWWGLRNYAMFYADPLERIAITNSLYFTLLAVPLRVLGALGLALLLRRPRRGTGFYRAAVYLPTVIPDVAYALIWLWVFNPIYGPINLLLGALGLPQPAWLADAATAKLVFVFMALFQIGEGFVVLLAGLQTIPREYADAATVDGAGPGGFFRHITLPLLAPWLALLTARDIIWSFQYTFTPSLLMTRGDPYHATLFLPLLAYEETFANLRFGMGAAILVVMAACSLALVVAFYALVRRWTRADAA
jgi:multiple sugar transport system permease protein